MDRCRREPGQAGQESALSVVRVLFLQQQPCMRSLKYAVGLRAVRAPVTLGFACQGQTLSEWYGSGDELFDRWWRLGPDLAGDLAEVMADFGPDLVHSHNLPDRLTVVAGEVAGGRVPVVHDCHDLQSLRRTPYEDGFPEPADPLALEKAAVEGSSALVAVSDEMQAEIEARHRIPALACRFANYALARDLPPVLPPADRELHDPPRLVYQGTLSTNGGHYDLREIFQALVASGVSLDVYPGRPAPAYAELADTTPGMRCLTTLEPAQLFGVLPSYDFGWAGFNASLNRAHLDTALPNKAFEYLGCGLPVLTLGHRALARLVDEHGVGVSLTTLDGLGAKLRDTDVGTLRRRVAKARPELTVEAHIHRIVGLYQALAGTGGRESRQAVRGVSR